MNPMTQTMKTPKMSTTKLSTNPDIDFARLLDMSNQTLDTEMVPPIDQDQLDTASGMRDIGSLAAALSGAVRGAGSVGSKLPNDFGFDQIARDLGNSRSVDLQNRMALRKQQENDMLEAIKNTGIAAQAQAKAERRVKPLSNMDRRIANARLKQFDPKVPDLPDDMTYGNLEEEPFLAQILGIDNGTSGMSEYQKTMTDLRNTEVNAAIDARNRELAMKGVKSSGEVDEASNENAQVDPVTREAIGIGLKKIGINKIPDSLTNKDVRTNPLYQSILKGAVPTTDQLADNARQNKKDDNKEEKLTPVQLQTQRKALAADLRKEKVPEAVDLVEKIEKILARNPEDIPGVGATGALKGPLSLGLSKDGQELRGLMTKQLNTILNARAGLAVTQGEFDRVAAELAGNWWQSDESFVRQFNLMKGALKEVIINTWGGYGDQVKNAYMQSSMDSEGNKTPGGRNFGSWAANAEDYVPGQKKGNPTPKTGTQVPGNENIPQGALDSATDNYNAMMGDKAPKATPSPTTKLNAKDQELFDWAQKNPNDPKAQQVMKIIQRKLGTK